ncbi:MAG TPA: cytochrome C [Sulfurovum sp.]|nr:cytochrome C [Sulfurovum sp.]
MKNITKIALGSLIGLTLLTISTDAASINKGQKIFSKKLKGACGFTGAKFAASFKQKEWEEIFKAGKMEEEARKLCPNIQVWEKKWEVNLFEFVYEYGADSGNEPAC